MAERRPLNSENGWLSTRNKTKMTPKQTIGKRRGSLPKFKVSSSPFLLTQNSPPPKQLLAATKQTAVTHFFKPTAQASLDDRVDYQPDTETMTDSPVDTGDANDNTYTIYTQPGECFTSGKGENSDTDDDHNHSSSRSYSTPLNSPSSLVAENRHKPSPNNVSSRKTTTKGDNTNQSLILSGHTEEKEHVFVENICVGHHTMTETHHRTCVDGSDSISFAVKNAAYGERARKRRPSDELDSLQRCVKKQRNTVQHIPNQVDGDTADIDLKNILQYTCTPSEHNDSDNHFNVDASWLSAIEFDTVVNHTNSNDSPITPKSSSSRDVFAKRGIILNSEIYDDNYVHSASNADVTNVDDDSELSTGKENHDDDVDREAPVDESDNIELGFSLESDSEFTLRSQRLKFDRLQANVNAILSQNDEYSLSFDTDSQFHF